MTAQLVLSLFPGIGLLDTAFEEVGFTVVRGPDVLWGGDIRRFHPPARRFDGVIGGPPCQCFSRLAHMVRHNGYEPKFGNLIPEFERCVREAEPTWFLMENVPDAPLPSVDGYGVHSFTLNNRQLGEVQNRVRRWSFGFRGNRRILRVETVALEPIDFEHAATGGKLDAEPVKMNAGYKPKNRYTASNALPFNNRSQRGFARLCELQGLPSNFDLPPFTIAAKCKAIGNGVPMAMGRAMAKAVLRATQEDPRP